MIMKINGKREVMERKVSLVELIEIKGLVKKSIVIEHNGNVVPKENWHTVILEENDNLEIVSFVSGG